MKPKITIEICPDEPRVTWLSVEGCDFETFERDLSDCAKSGDCEPACQYIIDEYDLEFYIVARENGIGDYVSRPASREEKIATAKEIYFESESDFEDDNVCNMYLIWELAHSFSD